MASTRAGLGARLRYRFDNTLSRGTGAVIRWLAVLTLVFILIAGAVLAIAGISTGEAGRIGLVEATWQSLMRTLDAGTMGGDAGWAFRTVSLVVTVGGIFVVSALIGLIATGLDQKVEELRKGRSPVLEEGHTLILGWSPK